MKRMARRDIECLSIDKWQSTVSLRTLRITDFSTLERGTSLLLQWLHGCIRLDS